MLNVTLQCVAVHFLGKNRWKKMKRDNALEWIIVFLRPIQLYTEEPKKKIMESGFFFHISPMPHYILNPPAATGLLFVLDCPQNAALSENRRPQPFYHLLPIEMGQKWFHSVTLLNHTACKERLHVWIEPFSLKMPGPISQNGIFYSNDASSPKISWFQISFKSV